MQVITWPFIAKRRRNDRLDAGSRPGNTVRLWPPGLAFAFQTLSAEVQRKTAVC